MTSFRRSPLLTDDALLHQVVNTLISEGFFDQYFTNDNLLSLGESIELTSKQRVENNAQVFKLTDVIQGKIPVARFYVSGSYGRRVTVGTPKIDLVVFLRGTLRLPPYDKSNDDLLPRLHRQLATEFKSTLDVKILPLCPSGCCLESGNCRVRGDKEHQCCPGYISAIVKDVRFRIYLAPALGRNSEEQRQATYRYMQSAFMSGGLSSLTGWHASLIEKPSEAMAHKSSSVQGFIRVCQYWVRVNKINNFDEYAVETLAFLVAKQIEKNVESSTDEYNNQSSSFDFVQAFRTFLQHCCHLPSVSSMCEIESPAQYVSPWACVSSQSAILTDTYNPYKNLLSTLTQDDQEHLALAASETLNLIGTAESPVIKQVRLKEVFTPAVWKGSDRSGSYLLLLLSVMILFSALYGGLILQKTGGDTALFLKTAKEMLANDGTLVTGKARESLLTAKSHAIDIVQGLKEKFGPMLFPK